MRIRLLPAPSFDGSKVCFIVSPPPLFARMLDAQNAELTIRQPYAAQHQAVALERLNGFDTHAAHHFLNFVVPGRQQIHQPLAPHFRV